MTIVDAAKELYDVYGPQKDKNVTAIGHDNIDTIHIYTKSKVSGYPSEYNGFKVVVDRVGIIRPA